MSDNYNDHLLEITTWLTNDISNTHKSDFQWQRFIFQLEQDIYQNLYSKNIKTNTIQVYMDGSTIERTSKDPKAEVGIFYRKTAP